MQYNLIRNSYFRSLTTSGTGNVSLTWPQLESLMDQNTISSGVTLTTSGILYLETDLSQRIKVDGVRLYASDLSKSSNINFYYKNTESDSYTLLTTQSGTSYYYTTITTPSAPQFMRVTVSGISVELYEFLIYNDDYIVAFGEDGQTYAESLDNAPIGEEGDSQAIAIYNNDTSAIPATGYTAIDYTGTDADNYIKISASENGTYRGIEDGVMVEDNYLSSNYIWDMGDYVDNTTVENNKLILIDTDTSSALDKLGDLPLTDGSESLNVGESAMAYDSVNEVIYALGCEASPTILKLYKYDIPTNNWTYLWEVNPGVTGFENTAGICYLDGYVYIMCNYSSYTFGRYDMVTMSGVWESLATLSGAVPTATSTAFSMDSDGVDCVYLASADGLGAPGTTTFQKYNTVSGTWGVLDDGFGRFLYGGTGNYPFTVSISYDTDRDYVYSIAGEYNETYGYVSRYDVSTNTWTTDYLNRATLGGNPFKSCIAYYGDYIVLYGYGYTPTAYLYHIPSDSSRSINVGSPTIHADGPHTNNASNKSFMCAINPRKSNDTMSIIFGCVLGYEDELYGYNMTPVYESTGTYISPIFKVDDAYSSSYFIVDATTTSGFTSVSYDAGSYNGTIRVRSGIEPTPINEVYWYVGIGSFLEVYKYNLYNFDGGNWITTADATSALKTISTAADRRTGHVATSYSRNVPTGKGAYSRSEVIIYNRDATELYSNFINAGSNNPPYERYGFDVNMEFDKFGGIWGYNGDRAFYLLHFDYQLVSELASIYDGGTDFLYDFAVELDGDGVWYTNKSLGVVYHLDAVGTELQQITLQTPRAICGTSDNGCWVVDNTDYYARRYDSSANIVKSVYLGRTASRMCTDYNDGFWYFNSSTSNVYHLNSVGTVLSTTGVANVSRLRGLNDGCIVWSSSNDFVKHINSNGSITHTFNGPSSTTSLPGAFAHNHTDHLNYHTDFLPISYDPVWGTGGSASWKEVSKDGYFLPKEQYHQVELTLRTTNAAYTPYVNKLLMAPAVKIEDIPSKSYKNMYIKTDIPNGADIADHEARLKTWWRVEE